MLGIILCGGQSTRMGSDKGLLVNEQKTWAQTAAGKLQQLNLPVKFSVNEKQQQEYTSIVNEDELITDNSKLKVKGPLLGVLSAHLAYPDDDLFIFACDLLHMESGLIKELFAIYNAGKKYETYIFTNNTQPEPLCAIYTASALKKIALNVAGNELHRSSMKYWLQKLIVCEIALLEFQKKAFHNFNAHADLNGL